MFSRMALLFLCVCTGVTCAGADDKAAANKIFVETVQLLKQAAAAQPSDAVGLYEKALRNLDSIVANYPSSDLAVQLISGQAIGQVSRTSIERALDEARQTALEKTELEKLRGTWQISEAIAEGEPAPEEDLKTLKTAVKLVFSGDLMKLVSSGDLMKPVDSGSNIERESTFKLDPAKKPKAIDIWPSEGQNALPWTGPGIYEVDGDTITLCLYTLDVTFGTSQGVTPGTDLWSAFRPKEFKSSKESKCELLMVLKRSKS